MQQIVDTNIIGTLNKIELLECRRFNERPNSLYYYYSNRKVPMVGTMDTFSTGTLLLKVALHIVLNLFYYFIIGIIPVIPRFLDKLMFT